MSRPANLRDLFGLQSTHGGGAGAGTGAVLAQAEKLVQEAFRAAARGDLVRARQLLNQARELLATVTHTPLGKEHTLLRNAERALEYVRGVGAGARRFSQRARDLLVRALNSIRNHLKSSDIEAAVRQLKTGKKVAGYDHLKEVKDALQSIKNAIDALKAQLAHCRQYGNCDKELISALEAQIKKLLDLYNSVACRVGLKPLK